MRQDQSVHRDHKESQVLQDLKGHRAIQDPRGLRDRWALRVHREYKVRQARKG
ncbi:MAG: hypothetical protein HYV04_03015 [Deltaproteobacteria bacterium]|nr:hypothetical protein [Deltaproteobacteria bacterium]